MMYRVRILQKFEVVRICGEHDESLVTLEARLSSIVIVHMPVYIWLWPDSYCQF